MTRFWHYWPSVRETTQLCFGRPFVVSPNSLLNKQSRYWWYGTPYSSCDVIVMKLNTVHTQLLHILQSSAESPPPQKKKEKKAKTKKNTKKRTPRTSHHYFRVLFAMVTSSNGNTFSALLALCVGNSPVTGEFPSQRPVTRSFDVFFDLRLNKRLSKQPRRWRFETPWRSLWRHCNAIAESGVVTRQTYSTQV